MTRTCECGARLPISEGRGRPLAYCSPRCRQRAYRARRAARPAPLPALPVELTSRARWVRWDESKRPLTAAGRPASVSDPSTWSDYATARASTAGVGIGFVLDGDGIGCIDLDDAIDEHGELSAEAARIVAEHPDALLVEVSPSGRGLHVWDRMPSRPGRRFVSKGQRVEVYSRARYLTVTGQRFTA